MKNKVLLNKMKRWYFKLPFKIHNIGLSATSIAIYSYLARGEEDFNPSINTIAKSLKLSKTTTVKYIKELKNRNIIKVIQPGREKVTTKYEFIDPADWT